MPAGRDIQLFKQCGREVLGTRSREEEPGLMDAPLLAGGHLHSWLAQRSIYFLTTNILASDKCKVIFQNQG